MELVYFVALGGLLLIVLLHAGCFSLLYVLVDGIVFVLNDLLCLLLVLYVGVFKFGLFAWLRLLVGVSYCVCFCLDWFAGWPG